MVQQWYPRSLPLRTDRSTLEFSGILKMKENSNETITVHGNPDHLDTERGRRGSIGQGSQP